MKLIKWSTENGNIHTVFKPNKPIDDLADEDAIRLIRVLTAICERRFMYVLQTHYEKFILGLRDMFPL